MFAVPSPSDRFDRICSVEIDSRRPDFLWASNAKHLQHIELFVVFLDVHVMPVRGSEAHEQ